MEYKVTMPTFDLRFFKALVGELLCTYIFMLSVLYAKGIGDLGGIIVGMTSIALIICFGPISGAHFNPAVSFAAMIGGKLHWITGFLYMFLQVLGATLASFTYEGLVGMSPDQLTFVSDIADRGAALGQEVLLTFILCFVIFCTAMGINKYMKLATTTKDIESQVEETTNESVLQDTVSQQSQPPAVKDPTFEPSLLAPIAIGLTLGFLCYMGSDKFVVAFNPAVATGVAPLVNQATSPTHIDNRRFPLPANLRKLSTDDLTALYVGGLWIYWLGDFIGALLAAVVYTFFAW